MSTGIDTDNGKDQMTITLFMIVNKKQFDEALKVGEIFKEGNDHYTNNTYGKIKIVISPALEDDIIEKFTPQ